MVWLKEVKVILDKWVGVLLRTSFTSGLPIFPHWDLFSLYTYTTTSKLFPWSSAVPPYPSSPFPSEDFARLPQVPCFLFAFLPFFLHISIWKFSPFLFGLPQRNCRTCCLARGVADQPDVERAAGRYALRNSLANLHSPFMRLACFESLGLNTTAYPSIVIRQSFNFVAYTCCRSEICQFA